MPSTPYPINEVFAWVIDDPTGEHAIMGVLAPGGTPMQAISSKRSTMERPELKHIAALTAEDTGLPVRLQRFVLAETLAEEKP